MFLAIRASCSLAVRAMRDCAQGGFGPPGPPMVCGDSPHRVTANCGDTVTAPLDVFLKGFPLRFVSGFGNRFVFKVLAYAFIVLLCVLSVLHGGTLL